MAIYDRNEDRIVVRVVYDGLGNAGKSTNIRQLCSLFTLQRRSELYVPEERSGRTLYFDWMQIESGLVGGYRLRCQVLSVPGQFVLRERRARLLKTADVIVLVCDSTPEGVERVRRGLERTRRFMADHGHADVPFILQANKQDLTNALEPDQVAAALGFGADTRAIAARAVEGVGVRETIVLALRAAADRVQRQLLARGIEALEGAAESAQDLFEDMRKNETYDDETVALAALLDDSLANMGTNGATAPSLVRAREAAPEAATAAAEAPGIPQLAANDGAPPELVPSMQGPLEAPAAPAAATTSKAVAAPDPAPDPAPRSEAPVLPPQASQSAPTEALPALAQQVESAPEPPPGWPLIPRQAKDVPSGLVWPTLTAREILRSLEGATPIPILDRVAQAGGDGSGKHGLVLYRVQDYCFKTNLSRHFVDIDHAREAMLAVVRLKQSLGKCTPDGTVLMISHDDNGYWLWTATPWVETLQARMTAAAQHGDEAGLSQALLEFAEAAMDALRLYLTSEILLDLHPSNFAHAGGRVIYLDDEVARDRSTYPLLHALLHRVEQYGNLARSLEPYISCVAHEFARFTADELRRLQVLPHLMELSPHAAASRDARERWMHAVRRVVLAAVGSAPALEATRGERSASADPFRRAPSFAPSRPASEPQLPAVSTSPPANAFEQESGTRDYALTRAASTPAPDREPAAAETAPASSHAPPAPGQSVHPAAPLHAGADPGAGVPPQVEASAAERPPLPLEVVDKLPSGYIWPGTKGRELIRRLAGAVANETQSGSTDRCYRAGAYVLHTSDAQRFTGADDARAALLARARALVPTLGRDPSDFVLVLVPAVRGDSHWLWTIEAAAS